MPKENLTEIICIIDRSGSMGSIKSDAIGGFNSFIEEQKKVSGEANVTLTLFNHNYVISYSGKPLSEVEHLNENTYVPSGTTALLDAVGRTIDDTGHRLSNTHEEERPAKVIVTILTDGLENASKDYTRRQVFDKIKHQREVYKWEFVFLAANQDAFAEASKIGIEPNMTVNFKATGEGTRRAYEVQSEIVKKHRGS